jgi:hypothetical protein
MVNHKCKAVSLSHGISHPAVIRPFCALLAQGMSDFVAIEQHREIEERKVNTAIFSASLFRGHHDEDVIESISLRMEGVMTIDISTERPSCSDGRQTEAS